MGTRWTSLPARFSQTVSLSLALGLVLSGCKALERKTSTETVTATCAATTDTTTSSDSKDKDKDKKKDDTATTTTTTDCTSSGGSGSTTQVSPLTVTPAAIALKVGESTTFTASGGVPPYTYKVSSGPGTIDSSGLFVHGWRSGTSQIDVIDSKGSAVKASATMAGGIIQVGTSSADTTKGVGVDASGNVYVTGWSPGTFAGQMGSGYLYAAKFSSNGTPVWIKRFGSSVNEQVGGLVVDAAGNLFVSGVTDTGFEGNTSAGSYDAFLIKIDTSGNKVWAKQLGSTGQEFSQGVALDSAGNIYLGGYTFGNLGGQANSGSTDAFAAKYDALGTLQWVRLRGGATSEIGRVITVDASGNVYVAFEATAGVDGESFGGTVDVGLVKWNSSGVYQWTRLAGSTGADTPYAIAAAPDGSIYVAGESSSATLDGQTANGGMDMLLMKYNASGTRQWSRFAGSSATDRARAVAVDANGRIWLGGQTAGSVGATNAGGDDLLIVQLDSDGVFMFASQFGGTGNDVVSGLAIDTAGYGYFSGHSNGSVDGNTSAGANDQLVGKLSPLGAKQ